MTRKPEPPTEQAVDAFETKLIQAFRCAARSRGLRVIELAGFLATSGATMGLYQDGARFSENRLRIT